MGNKVAEHRKKKGLTQQQLADLLKIDRSHLGKIEVGKAKPSIALLERIAEALDCSLKDLF